MVENLIFEGATADAFETTVRVTDPTADRTVTIPDLSGTIQLQGQNLLIGDGGLLVHPLQTTQSISVQMVLLLSTMV